MPSTDYLKPLFNKRLLQEALRSASLTITDEQRQIARDWAHSAATGALARQNERPLQGQFLTEFFDRLLGFKQIVGSETGYFMEPETGSKLVKGYKPPDARLGWFGTGREPQTRGVIELKAPGADLDGKQGGKYGNITPVEQAFGYAVKADGCRWVIVSNYTALRVYRTDRGQGYCHAFRIADLADDERLRELLLLLGRDTLLGATPEAESLAYRLASHTHVEEQRITQEFYAFFHDLRLRLFQQLRQDNPAPAGADVQAHGLRLLEHAQKILDRVLFICFCEDTGLLPPRVLRTALASEHVGFVPVSRWQQLCGLFNAVDRGHPPLRINGYNGGLFAQDAALDGLAVPDAILGEVLKLAAYDYETDLNVNILGHIFEQSISDLEAIRADIRGEVADPQRSRRKRDGIFYTPDYITRFIVGQTIGGWLAERHAEAERQVEAEWEANPRTSKRGKAKPETEKAKLVWSRYLEALGGIKVVDPACGSGAFLVAAFDYLLGEYERVNRKLAELTGQPAQLDLFDLDRQILQENLFGVDLNPESVEITKLGLWLKTARKDKPLNKLDGNIRCGNSLVEPPGDDPELGCIVAALPPGTRAFAWREAFPAVFERGGFDIVLGNPPYVRQESIGPFKPYLQKRYASYHGAADLYVYFYERGLNLLAPTGKLSYIVTNKWFRAGYGEPLRRLFAGRAEFEAIIDFGHAPIFEDADTFPCIVVARHRPEPPTAEPYVRVCPVPRDRPSELSLEQYVEEQSYPVPWSRYGTDAWSLESPDVEALMAKIRGRGVPLREFAGVKPYRGVLTGFNEAFLIDEATRLNLIRDDPGCAGIIKPYLRGQDIGRWVPDWQGLWMIFARRGIDIDAYPSVKAHLERFRSQLEPKPEGWSKATQGEWPGRKPGKYAWYEIQDSIEYWEKFEGPKIVYQEIQFHPQYALSEGPLYGNNKVFLLPGADLYLLACLNSPLLWWFNWRNLPHMKDEALNPAGFLMETLPIAEPAADLRREVEEHTGVLLELALDSQRGSRELLDWLRLEYGVDKPGQKLEAYANLAADDFAAEVRQRRPKSAPRLSPAKLAELKQTHHDYATLERHRQAETLGLERQLAGLVNRAYGLSEDDIALLWRTAPPRMPIDMA